MALNKQTGISGSTDNGLFPVIILLALTVLFFVNLIPVQRDRKAADELEIRVSSDAEMLRSEAVLAGDAVVYDYLLENVPPQTPVSIPYHESEAERIQRFWLALLPDYPIRSSARLSIVVSASVPSGAAVLVSGDRFTLVQHRAAGAAE